MVAGMKIKKHDGFWFKKKTDTKETEIHISNKVFIAITSAITSFGGGIVYIVSRFWG